MSARKVTRDGTEREVKTVTARTELLFALRSNRLNGQLSADRVHAVS